MEGEWSGTFDEFGNRILYNRFNNTKITVWDDDDGYTISVESPEHDYNDIINLGRNKQKTLRMIDILVTKFTDVENLKDLLDRKKKTSKPKPKRISIKKCKCK